MRILKVGEMFAWDDDFWEEKYARKGEIQNNSILDSFDKIYSDMFNFDSLDFSSYDSFSILDNMSETQRYVKSDERNHKIKQVRSIRKNQVSKSKISMSEEEVEQAIAEGSRKVGKFILKKGKPVGKKIGNKLRKFIKKKNNEVTFADGQ